MFPRVRLFSDSNKSSYQQIYAAVRLATEPITGREIGAGGMVQV
jgi:hypothetical protein